METTTIQAAAAALTGDQEGQSLMKHGNGLGTTAKWERATVQAQGGAGNPVMTLEQFVDSCTRLQPALAAQQEDSSLAVTPLITCLIVDGKTVQLTLVNGKWGAGYTRVSDEMQRSAKSWTNCGESLIAASVGSNSTDENDADGAEDADGESDAPPDEEQQTVSRTKGRRGARRRHGKRRQAIPDGYSEEEQLNRQVRYFVSKGQAFRIYSDCGVTGEYPTNDPELIQKLLASQAARYEKIFRRTLLDETSRLRRTASQITAMEAYVVQRVAQIKRGALTDEEIEASEELNERAKRRLRGRGKKKAFFRQALTQLWRDIEAGCVHTLAVSDRSRLCRAADMETALLRLLFDGKVRLVGLIEDLSSLDVSDPVRRGLNYLVGAINEYRLEEIAGHAFRGVLQLLESGRPNGRLPWWLERDEDGRVILIEERAELVRRIVQMSLLGSGIGSIVNQLHDEGMRVGGGSLTRMQITYMLQSDALVGVQRYFGLEWPVYVRVIDDETMNELRERSAGRADGLENLHDTRTWAEHTFAGILKCACGSPLIFQHGAPGRIAVGDLGYYNCKRPFKIKSADEPTHSNINHQKLEAFFGDIFRHSMHLITDALTAGGARASSSRARRAVLEERWRVASAEYEAKLQDALTEAEKRATALTGLQQGSVGYQAVVDGLQASLMESETTKLATLRQEMLVVSHESSRDREAVRALEAVEALKVWDGLDARSRNRLLRAVFSHITIYPLGNSKRLGRGGYLEVKLAGIETPLPPIRMRRGPGRGIFLPTVAEWIADMFCGGEEGGTKC